MKDLLEVIIPECGSCGCQMVKMEYTKFQNIIDGQEYDCTRICKKCKNIKEKEEKKKQRVDTDELILNLVYE